MPEKIEDFAVEYQEGQCVRLESLEGLKIILDKPEDWTEYLLVTLST